MRGIITLDGSNEAERLARLDDACLDERGRLRVVPAATYASFSQNDLSLWCMRRGFYCLPTAELVEYLREEIGDLPAIEIGAGNGALGRALGIPMTDSYQQEREDMKALYAAMGQGLVRYGEDVEKISALAAVEKYEPRVVIAAWVTHRWDPKSPKREGNLHGVDEGKLLAKPYLHKYLFVGHGHVHRTKPILSERHSTYLAPWLYSRVGQADRIWIWSASKER